MGNQLLGISIRRGYGYGGSQWVKILGISIGRGYSYGALKGLQLSFFGGPEKASHARESLPNLSTMISLSLYAPPQKCVLRQHVTPAT